MKTITDRDYKRVTNGLGLDSYCCYQNFEIEITDNKELRNYLGFGKPAHRVNAGDIISVLTDDTGWTCWSFVSKAKKANK